MATDLLNRRVIRVPNVVGRPVNKARILLEDAGFRNIVTLYRESYEDRDTVLDQRPPRTQMVYEDTEVVIWVARRGYLENLPAIYRRSDAVGRNLVRELCFVFTMPMKYEDVATAQVIRIHQITQMEQPAHTHYYLRFAEEKGEVELREFFAIGLRSGIGIGAEVVQSTDESEEKS